MSITVDRSHAAQHVLHVVWVDIGLDVMVSGSRAFVNVTEDLLVSGVLETLPAESTVIEVLETVDPTPAVVEACRELKRLGYTLALDDFVYRPELEPLIAIADIIKIGFDECVPEEQCTYIRQFGSPQVRLLAEKVETKEEFDHASELGFSLFQGWFFCHPEIVTGQTLTAARITYLRMIQVVSRSDYEIDDLVQVVQGDVAITHRLLRYLASAAFPWRKPVTSIRHALMLLGQSGTRRWVSLTALGEMSDQPRELLVSAAVRASFCENLANDVGLTHRQPELFLLGAFSLIDAMLGQPMSVVLQQLPLADDLKGALQGQSNPLRPVLECVETYERGEWDQCSQVCSQLRLNENRLAPHYRSAVTWSVQTFSN